MPIPRYDDSARRFAHDVVDLVFDHVRDVEQRPVVDWTSWDDLRELVRSDRDPLDLVRLVLVKSNQLHHPRYIGHQVCPPFAPAVVADFLISATNNSAAVWEMSPIGTVIEREMMRWLADLAGYPAECEATAVSGGSAANLTALLAARARWNANGGGDRPVILASGDAHYSVARAASIMGIDDVVKIDTDDAHRIDLAALEDAVRSHGSSILAIVATAGSTATGAFDDLVAIRRIAGDRWMHVDAAHGASVLLSDNLKHLVSGLESADSFAWDPHKMLWMPLSLGAVLVRDGIWLRRAFEADAPYLFHAEREQQNIGAMTIQCSKRVDAIKLWLTLKMCGAEAFAAALDKVAAVTRYAHERVRATPELEAMHEPQFNIFCFRLRGADELNQRAREELMRSGEAWITSTMLKGRRVLRITVINPATEERHIDAMLEAVRRYA